MRSSAHREGHHSTRPHARLPKPPNGSEVDSRSLRCARSTCVDEFSGLRIICADTHTFAMSVIAEPARSTSALFDLIGQVALVTGGSSGLGRRFAQVLSAAGATVVICGHRSHRLEEVAAGDERIVAVPCDVTDEAAVAAMVERVETSD